MLCAERVKTNAGVKCISGERLKLESDLSSVSSAAFRIRSRGPMSSISLFGACSYVLKQRHVKTESYNTQAPEQVPNNGNRFSERALCASGKSHVASSFKAALAHLLLNALSCCFTRALPFPPLASFLSCTILPLHAFFRVHFRVPFMYYILFELQVLTSRRASLVSDPYSSALLPENGR